MSVRSKEYHRPKDWANVHELLGRSDVPTVPLAISPKPVGLTDQKAEAFVDLENLQLRYIRKNEDNRICLGAMTTLQELYESEILQKEASGILAQAAHYSASLGIRNLASLAGLVGALDNPQDVVIALEALDAVVVIQKSAEQRRQLPLYEYITSGAQVLNPGELIVEINFPAALKASGGLARLGRTPRDHAMVAAAAVLEVEENTARRVGLALAGANPFAVRLFDVEKLLLGKSLSAELLVKASEMAEKQAVPQGDYRGSAPYRQAMAGVLTRRALEMAWKQAEKPENGRLVNDDYSI